MTGSQKVAGSNPAGSTKKAFTANTFSNQLSIGTNPFELQMALGISFEDVFKRHIVASPVDRLTH